MNQQLIKTFSLVLSNTDCLIYNLFFRNALYSLECKKNMEQNNESNYCYLENFTEDEGEAEFFFHRVTEGRVYPMHIKEMASDIIQS